MTDRTAAFLRDGYLFLPRLIPPRGWVELRLMGMKAVAIGGPEAPEVFYAPGRFTRNGAMPPTTLRLLQDRGSVQTLDGDAHRLRKAAFLALLLDESRIAALRAEVTGTWRRRAADWRPGEPVVLLDEAERVLTEAVCAWAGIPLSERELDRRTREFSAMVGKAGAANAGLAGALALRRRCERWAERLVRQVRSGERAPEAGAPLAVVAGWTGQDGAPLPIKVAAVELLNVLRPTVATARFVVFAAMAMRARPRWRARLAQADEAAAEAFAQEVRRFFPFFPAIAGRVREPFEWAGRDFRQGEWVIADLYGANHDPGRWDDPGRFDPERFLRGAVADAVTAQGAGDARLDHRCPGERITVEVVKAAALELARADYRIPPQDLRLRVNRLPTAPESGFVLVPA